MTFHQDNHAVDYFQLKTAKLTVSEGKDVGNYRNKKDRCVQSHIETEKSRKKGKGLQLSSLSSAADKLRKISELCSLDFLIELVTFTIFVWL